METLKLNITQRRFLAENFRDALVNSSVNGDNYFKSLGSTTQATMREAVNFICMNKPIQAKLEEAEVVDGDSKKKITNVTVFIELFQPGTNDKITLERTFSKSLLDVQ